MEKTKDRISWMAKWRIDKFHDSTGRIAVEMKAGMSTAEAMKLYGKEFICSEKFDSNLALNEGVEELIDVICGLGAPAKWDSTHAYLGVGDSNAAVSAAQMGLQAQTNKTFKAMDANYPQRTNQTAEWRATFGSDDANFGWEEYTVVMLLRMLGKT